MADCPKAGVRVCLRPGAARSRPGPWPGECGAVREITFVTKDAMNLTTQRTTCFPAAAPSGGLVYVKWDRGKVFGVFRGDLVVERTGAALGRARRRRGR